jgi:hypothetical protein
MLGKRRWSVACRCSDTRWGAVDPEVPHVEVESILNELGERVFA